MKKNFKIIILFFVIFLIQTNNRYSKIYPNNNRVRMFAQLPYAILINKIINYRILTGISFYHTILNNTTFFRCIMQKVKYYHTSLIGTKFFHCILDESDFEGADLTNADFTDSHMKNVKNLEKTKSVKGANFKGVKCLTNEEKDFLRENGAINVPINIEYDSTDDGRIGKKEKVRNLLERFFVNCIEIKPKGCNVGTQTDFEDQKDFQNAVAEFLKQEEDLKIEYDLEEKSFLKKLTQWYKKNIQRSQHQEVSIQTN